MAGIRRAHAWCSPSHARVGLRQWLGAVPATRAWAASSLPLIPRHDATGVAQVQESEVVKAATVPAPDAGDHRPTHPPTRDQARPGAGRQAVRPRCRDPHRVAHAAFREKPHRTRRAKQVHGLIARAVGWEDLGARLAAPRRRQILVAAARFGAGKDGNRPPSRRSGWPRPPCLAHHLGDTRPAPRRTATTAPVPRTLTTRASSLNPPDRVGGATPGMTSTASVTSTVSVGRTCSLKASSNSAGA